jgi:hypothetical protein
MAAQMADPEPTAHVWARLLAGDWPGAVRREAGGRRRRGAAPRAAHRSAVHQSQQAGKSRLVSLHPTMPTHAGAAVDAVVAALPRRAKRQLRAVCRAGRAAVDARTTALGAGRGLGPAGLSAALARMPRLLSLDCCVGSKADCAELAAALAAAPASLFALRYVEAFQPASADGAEPPQALADAIASRPGLAELELDLGRRPPALCDAFVAAVGRLPRLRTLRLWVVLQRGNVDPWREAPPALAPPSTLQASAVRLSMPRG